MSEPSAAKVAYLQHRVSRLRRRLWWERLVFLLIIVGLVALVSRQRRIAQAYLVTVGEHQVAVMGSLREAEEAIELVKRMQAPGWQPDQVDFRPELRLSPVARTEVPYSAPRAAARALARVVQLVVPGYGISVNGRVLVALRTKREAKQALDRVRAHYPYAETGAHFKEKVRVVRNPTPVSELATVETTYRLLIAPVCRYHLVRPSDSTADICRRYGLEREQLARLNPKVSLAALRPGTRLLVARSQRPPVTVETRSERYLTAAIPFPVEQTLSNQLPQGARKVLQQGAPGRGKYLVRVTYMNGREVRQERILQEVLQPPTPSKVLVGG